MEKEHELSLIERNVLPISVVGSVLLTPALVIMIFVEPNPVIDVVAEKRMFWLYFMMDVAFIATIVAEVARIYYDKKSRKQ